MENNSVEELRLELLKNIEESQKNHIVSLKIPILRAFLDRKLPYVEKYRGFGQGSLRIGTSLEFGDDIYSLGFCC